MKLYPIFCLLVLSLQAEVDCRNIDDVNVDVGSGIAHNLDTFSNSLVVVAVDSLVQVPDGGQEQRLQVEQQEELQYKVQQERLDENQQLKVHQLQGEEQRVQREEDKPQQQQLLTSPLCINKTRSSTSSAAPGCIMGSLIPRSKTYLVEFKDSDKTVEDPSVCWRTCKLIYPNTSLALVSKSEPSTTASEAKLICHCALGDAIDETMIGPEIFCNSVCDNGTAQSTCGGRHTFKDNQVTETFFSVICIDGNPAPPTPPPPPPITTTSSSSSSVSSSSSTTTTASTSTTTTTPSDVDDDSLHNILESLVDGNVMSIVIIGLMICLIILLLVLVTWIYLFVESLDPAATAAFYRD